MSTLKTILVALAALTLVPLAHAQTANNSTSDPTVSDADFNTTAPPADDAYLNDTNASTSPTDPTVANSDFDTSVPASDTSYLNDSTAAATPPAPAAPTNKTPGPELGLIVLGAAAIALVKRR